MIKPFSEIFIYIFTSICSYNQCVGEELKKLSIYKSTSISDLFHVLCYLLLIAKVVDYIATYIVDLDMIFYIFLMHSSQHKFYSFRKVIKEYMAHSTYLQNVSSLYILDRFYFINRYNRYIINIINETWEFGQLDAPSSIRYSFCVFKIVEVWPRNKRSKSSLVSVGRFKNWDILEEPRIRH